MSSFQDTISKYPPYVPPEAIEEWDPTKVKTNLEQGVPLFSFLDQSLETGCYIHYAKFQLFASQTFH